MVMNAIGTGLGVVFRRWRGLDEAIDLRISYVPSPPFRELVSRKGYFGAGEDYTGQTFLVGFHLKSIPQIRTSPSLRWLQYVDLTASYRTVDYKPIGANPRTLLYLGVSLNLQHVLRGLEGAPAASPASPPRSGRRRTPGSTWSASSAAVRCRRRACAWSVT
jgi:hypothetical protein